MGLALVVPDISFSASNLGKVTFKGEPVPPVEYDYHLDEPDGYNPTEIADTGFKPFADNNQHWTMFFKFGLASEISQYMTLAYCEDQSGEPYGGFFICQYIANNHSLIPNMHAMPERLLNSAIKVATKETVSMPDLSSVAWPETEQFPFAISRDGLYIYISWDGSTWSQYIPVPTAYSNLKDVTLKIGGYINLSEETVRLTKTDEPVEIAIKADSSRFSCADLFSKYNP